MLNTTGSLVTTLLASSPPSKIADQTQLWIAGVSVAMPKTPPLYGHDSSALSMPHSA